MWSRGLCVILLSRYKMSSEDDDKIHKNSSTNNNNDNDDAPTKKEDEYDVIICGTDLIQSILSSALSRAGKKVLHCDGEYFYLCHVHYTILILVNI